MALARDALRHPRTAACVLVSDDTLPMLSPARIHAEISARPDRIDVGLAKRNPRFLRRYTDWFFMDSPATSARPLAVEECGIECVASLARLGAPVVILPQSLAGHDDFWRAARGITVFCRDAASLDHTRRFPNLVALPADDMAIGLDLSADAYGKNRAVHEDSLRRRFPTVAFVDGTDGGPRHG